MSKENLYRTAAYVTAFSIAEKAFGFLYRVILSRTLGSEGMGLYQVALSVFVVFATMIGCAVFFDKMRKGAKKDDFKAMPSFDQVDTAARESFPLVTLLYGILAVAAVIILVLTTVGSFSIFSLFMICATALIAAVVGEYGTMFFVPSIYSRLKLRADNYAAAKAVKYQGAKKAEKAE